MLKLTLATYETSQGWKFLKGTVDKVLNGWLAGEVDTGEDKIEAAFLRQTVAESCQFIEERLYALSAVVLLLKSA